MRGAKSTNSKYLLEGILFRCAAIRNSLPLGQTLADQRFRAEKIANANRNCALFLEASFSSPLFQSEEQVSAAEGQRGKGRPPRFRPPFVEFASGRPEKTPRRLAKGSNPRKRRRSRLKRGGRLAVKVKFDVSELKTGRGRARRKKPRVREGWSGGGNRTLGSKLS